jgi:hypothetical protein
VSEALVNQSESFSKLSNNLTTSNYKKLFTVDTNEMSHRCIQQISDNTFLSSAWFNIKILFHVKTSQLAKVQNFNHKIWTHR